MLDDHETRIRKLETEFTALEAQLKSEMKHITEKLDLLFEEIGKVNVSILALNVNGALQGQKSTYNEKGMAVLVAIVFSVAGFFLARGWE